MISINKYFSENNSYMDNLRNVVSDHDMTLDTTPNYSAYLGIPKSLPENDIYRKNISGIEDNLEKIRTANVGNKEDAVASSLKNLADADRNVKYNGMDDKFYKLRDNMFDNQSKLINLQQQYLDSTRHGLHSPAEQDILLARQRHAQQATKAAAEEMYKHNPDYATDLDHRITTTASRALRNNAIKYNEFPGYSNASILVGNEIRQKL